MRYIKMPWTVAAAAEELGMSVSGVRKLLRNNRLARFPVHGDVVLITGESMDRLRGREIDGRKLRHKKEADVDYPSTIDLLKE